MPFVNAEHRASPDGNIPGDRCYLYYKEMVRVWKANPRWTTADNIYGAVVIREESKAEQRAKELAWQVFFQIYVMPYELMKQKENGDI